MIYDSAQGNITIAVAGDSMITRPMSMFKEERFLKLVDLLRSADASKEIHLHLIDLGFQQPSHGRGAGGTGGAAVASGPIQALRHRDHH